MKHDTSYDKQAKQGGERGGGQSMELLWHITPFFFLF